MNSPSRLYPCLLRLAGPAPARVARALWCARALIPFALLLGLIFPALLPAQSGVSPAPLGGPEQPDPSSSSATPEASLSPYFWVQTPLPPGADSASASAAADPLPLKSTAVEVLIAGLVAEVRVTQTYANRGQIPLEALYVFPGSTRAAVRGLTLTVGERRIEATLQERAAARATYEAAKTEGRTASLLEQARPNVFQMAVANILPGDLVQVELRYTELLEAGEGLYTFVYPGVVGPRYVRAPSPEAPAETWTANPYLPAGNPDPAAYTLALRLAAGVPIREMACATHSTRIDYTTTSDARVTLAPDDPAPSTRDFILHYRLAGPALASGLLLTEADPADPAGENYFLAQLQPPARPVLAERPPRDFVFVLDVSGSMQGFPLTIARRLLTDLLRAPSPRDTFNLLLFAGDSRALAEAPLPATPENLRRALALLDTPGGGGTELLPALRRALSLPRPHEATSRIVAVITDGYVSVEPEAYALVRTQLGQGNVFAFGIGSSVNRALIEALARAGQGEPFIVTDEASAAATATRFASYIEGPVLTGLELHADGLELYDLEPLSLPDVFARRPVFVLGKWRGPRSGHLEWRGRTGTAPYQARLALAEATVLPAASSPLASLWARQKIARLLDDYALTPHAPLKAEVTALGLRHQLLTPFTSFVAVDTVVRRTGPDLETVKQPLPLPSGVSNSAVGGAPIATAPEPATYGLFLLGAVLAWAYLRRSPRRAAS